MIEWQLVHVRLRKIILLASEWIELYIKYDDIVIARMIMRVFGGKKY